MLANCAVIMTARVTVKVLMYTVTGGSSCKLVVGRIGVDSNGGDAVFLATKQIF